MNSIKVKNLVIGEGVPKICIPIVSKTRDGILSELKNATTLAVDIIEWRVDYYECVDNFEKVKSLLREMVEQVPLIPIIFTFRTIDEGGVCENKSIDYKALNIEIAMSGLVDLMDIEYMKCDEEIIKKIQDFGCKVIISKHDFEKTPKKSEILNTYIEMQKMGADITKIAVMPKTKYDVLEMLSVSLDMIENIADRPFIAISMSEMGVITRIAGEIFGSAITFGAGSNSSASGQIDAKNLKQVLEIIKTKD